MRNIELKEEVKCKGEETEAARLIGTYVGTYIMYGGRLANRYVWW